MPTTGLLILSPAGYPGAGAPLDLSQYMDVNPADGLDIANPEFSQRTFSHALLREGGVQALENLVVKELTFPLKLHATTRDGVSALLQSVNVSIQQPGQTVLWQDQGSSQPTFFDIAGAQFDVEYDFRLAGHSYLKGKLRLFVQPLGHTATMRLVASAAGTGPLLVMPVPSPILGDAPALMQAQISGGSFASAAWETTALSVLPYGYVPEYQASQLQLGASTTLLGGSGAVASLFLRQTVGASIAIGTKVINASSLLCSLSWFAATPYFGVNRLLGLVRAGLTSQASVSLWDTNTSFYLQAQYQLGGTQAQVGPTTAFTAGAFAKVGATISAATSFTPFSVVDLGPVSIPSSLAAATLTVNVMLSTYLEIDRSASGLLTATSIFDLTDLILLPDAQTAFISPAAKMDNDNWVVKFDGINSESYITDQTGVLKFRETPVQRGAIPKIPVGASPQIAALFMAGASSSLVFPPANEFGWASVSVRERVRFSF